MTEKYKSEACAVIHEIAEGLHEDGVINTITMREFDDLCLSSPGMPFEQIPSPPETALTKAEPVISSANK